MLKNAKYRKLHESDNGGNSKFGRSLNRKKSFAEMHGHHDYHDLREARKMRKTKKDLLNAIENASFDDLLSFCNTNGDYYLMEYDSDEFNDFAKNFINSHDAFSFLVTFKNFDSYCVVDNYGEEHEKSDLKEIAKDIVNDSNIEDLETDMLL